jgi:hypothetical protein
MSSRRSFAAAEWTCRLQREGRRLLSSGNSRRLVPYRGLPTLVAPTRLHDWLVTSDIGGASRAG